jgi:hypothetical protein
MAEHARRERAEERARLMFSVQRLERVAHDNMETLRFHAVADDLGRKLDEVLRLVQLSPPAQIADPLEEQQRIEQRLVEPRPFFRR